MFPVLCTFSSSGELRSGWVMSKWDGRDFERVPVLGFIPVWNILWDYFLRTFIASILISNRTVHADMELWKPIHPIYREGHVSQSHVSNNILVILLVSKTQVVENKSHSTHSAVVMLIARWPSPYIYSLLSFSLLYAWYINYAFIEFLPSVLYTEVFLRTLWIRLIWTVIERVALCKSRYWKRVVCSAFKRPLQRQVLFGPFSPWSNFSCVFSIIIFRQFNIPNQRDITKSIKSQCYCYM